MNLGECEDNFRFGAMIKLWIQIILEADCSMCLYRAQDSVLVRLETGLGSWIALMPFKLYSQMIGFAL